MFICPVCGDKLFQSGKSMICPRHHCYDIAKQGYINLLMSGQSGEHRHGDDKKMIQARQKFLDSGAYQPLADALLRAAAPIFRNGVTILDAGCGECWYTSQFSKALCKRKFIGNVGGIDISRDALIAGAKRDPTIALAVASAYRLPVADHSCDAVLNIFSPCATQEFHRVLKSGGILVRAVPLERHLWELKVAVYDQPYENPPEEAELPGFVRFADEKLRYQFVLQDTASIMNLFCMTPYYYKTSEKDQAKLSRLSCLEVTAEFGVQTYRCVED